VNATIQRSEELQRQADAIGKPVPPPVPAFPPPYTNIPWVRNDRR
jgi:hypothetical protein